MAVTDIISSVKTCVRCGEEQPLTNFTVARTNRDGRSSWCRACYSEYNRFRSAPERHARLAAKEALSRRCLECGARLPAGLRADAQYCSTACVRRSVGRRWAQKHADRFKQARLAAKAARPRHCVECQKELPAAMPSDARACSKRCGLKVWQRENPDHWRKHVQKRAISKRTQFVEYVDRLVVLEMDDGVCGVCGGDVDPLDFHVDHIIPIALGGEHSYANVQAAHPRCNSRKHASLPWEMAA